MDKKSLINSLKKQNFPEQIIEAFENAEIEIYLEHKNEFGNLFMIAFMLTLLEIKKGHRILEIGSESDYLSALLSELNSSGKIYRQDSKKVWGESFDRIIVSSKCKRIPNKLLKQLKFKGIMIVPLQDKIVVVKKDSGENKIQEYPLF